jgi:hypothetical protein
MPVTFLRTPADYFGIQEAPAQPLFQQTRALADPAVQNQLNFQDQITALRQQRPLARTQAIQNEYNAIFENANRLRQQQEAAKQAEQAVGALVGIAGDQPDYLEKKRAIQSQFPMAALDQRVQSLFNDNDRIYTARQSVEARRQEERERQAAELTAAGIKDVNEAYRIVDQGLPAVGAAKYQLGRGGSGGGENARLKMIKSGLDTLAETLKNTPEEIEESEGKYVPNPVRKTLLDKYSQYSTEYQNELDRALFPQAKTATGGAAVPPPATVSTARPVEQPVAPPTEVNLANVPFTQQKQFIEQKKAADIEAKAVDTAWEKAQSSIERKIKNIVPDEPFEGTNVNQLESFARAVLNPGENIVRNPRYGTVPVAWDVLDKIGIVPQETVFREPGEGRRKLGFIGTQQVSYDELLKVWAKNFLEKRGALSPSPVARELPPATRSKALGNVMKAIETQ